jgi:hypothetical protein
MIIFFQPFVYCGCEVFIREIRRTQGRTSEEQIYENFVAQQGLDALLGLLLDLTRLYPVWRKCPFFSHPRSFSTMGSAG